MINVLGDDFLLKSNQTPNPAKIIKEIDNG